MVVGCGQSGLLAGIRLGEAGIPYTIVEKNAGVGGTWWENSYPGARVDVGNHFYCYSFEPSDHWTEFFAQQPELQTYFDGVMRKYGVDRHVRWGTEVLGAAWDDASATWSVRVRGADGTEDTLVARAVISAVGQLNRPNLPDIPGRDSFAGPAFHSARWDHDVELAGTRVAMIGAGASGFQIAPTIAPDVAHLTVFQRTAQWMFPNPNYHEQVGPGVRWALRHLPFYGRWYRFLIFWPGCDKGLEAARVDPDYPDQQTAVSEMNDLTRQMFTDWIVSQVDDDPELVAKVVPDYPATGKRTLQDNGSWLRTLTRDNVELVRTGIDHIEADAVVTDDGTRHEADVLVLATGFQATKVLFPMEITGAAARTSRDVGRAPGRLPRHHRAGVPELLLHVRARHEPRARRQPDLPFRMPDAVHHPGDRAADRGRAPDDGAAPRAVRGLARALAARDAWAGVVAAVDQALVLQERVRRDPRAEPVAARRLLDVDPDARSRRLRPRLTPSRISRRAGPGRRAGRDR